MATSEIQTKPDARAAFTLEIASNLAAGVGRIAAMLTNTNKRPAAEIGVRIKTGAVAPVAGGVYDVYLVRYDGLIADDGATGLVEAAYTQVNAEPLGSIVVTNSAATNFSKIFNTKVLDELGPYWTIAVVNRTTQAPSTVALDSIFTYTYLVPEAQ